MTDTGASVGGRRKFEGPGGTPGGLGEALLGLIMLAVGVYVIFDHVTVVYEWANGARGIVGQRQEAGCFTDNSDYVLGSTGKGWSGWNDPYIKSGDQLKWKYRGEKPQMYVYEHQQLYKAVRGGAWHNDGDWMASSTLMGIMGRLAAYTGQEVTWEQALNSKQSLVPQEFSWDMSLPIAPLALPGVSKLI